MFKLSLSESYLWPVVIEVPESGGRFVKFTFDAEFKRVSQTRISEIIEQHGKGELQYPELIKEVLVGWKGISDGSDEMPFSHGNLEKLLNIVGASSAIADSFIKSLSGSKTKNS